MSYLRVTLVWSVVTYARRLARLDKAEEQAKVDVTRMQAKIGELALANDFLESALVKAGLLSAKR